MTEQPATIAPVQTPSQRVRSTHRFPVYDLADCVVAAKAIHEKGGGAATNDQLAAYLGYRSTNNGAFINRVAAAKLFGLIEGSPRRYTITSRAQKILMPINVETDPRSALIEAFMAVPLYAAIYQEYHGKELPPKFGLQNALKTLFGVTPQRVERAYRAFMHSAETAGFFDVRGSRTHLILPSIQATTPKPPADEDDAGEGDGDAPQGSGGGGNNGGDSPKGRSLDALRSEYVSTLITLLKEKGAQGEVDTALMERIEKLLELSSGN